MLSRKSALPALLAALCLGLLVQSAAAEPYNLSTHTPWARYLAPEGRCRADISQSAPVAVRERAMLCLINWARTRAHLHALTASAQLHASAQMKVRAMAACDEFSHSACGHSFTYWFFRSGYLPAPGYSVGENIAAGTGVYGGVRDTMLAWLNSPGHRANILDPGYRDQGLAVYRAQSLLGQAGMLVWSSEFGVRYY